MKYLDAVRHASHDLADDDGDRLAQAALQLALDAWRHLADADLLWDIFGLELLDIHGRLYPDADVVTVTDPPEADRPELRTAVADLVNALAQRHNRLALNDTLPLAERLDHDATAQQLRDAAIALT